MGGRPSPPFAPSSLGDRRSLASAEGAGDESPSPQMQGLGLGTGTGTGTGKKRYSSSFTKRYSASAAGGGGAAGSEGSTGSGERNMGGERVAVSVVPSPGSRYYFRGSRIFFPEVVFGLRG